MNTYFRYHRKKIKIEAVECISLWSKFRGLMFRGKNTEALVFIFKKPTKISIHSFFCREFIAIWLDDKNKVIEIIKVEPWKFRVKPQKKFVKLVEIPINEKYYKIIKSLRSPSEDAKHLKR